MYTSTVENELCKKLRSETERRQDIPFSVRDETDMETFPVFSRPRQKRESDTFQNISRPYWDRNFKAETSCLARAL